MEQIYYRCLFLYAVIKAGLLPNINFMTLFVQTPIHSLSPHGLNGFIFLCRKEMPYYIRHEFIAGLQFNFLKDLFQEAMLVKKMDLASPQEKTISISNCGVSSGNLA